jgi:hypothetical protein
VLEIRPDEAQVVVGSRDALQQDRLTASGVNWISGEPELAWRRIAAQIRHRHSAAGGRVRALEHDRAEVEFDTPQTAPSRRVRPSCSTTAMSSSAAGGLSERSKVPGFQGSRVPPVEVVEP